MLQSRAVPRCNIFLEKTGCFMEQSSFWIEQIPGKDGMMRSRAVPGKDRMLQRRAVPGQNRFLEKTECCRTEQFHGQNRFLEKTRCCRAEQFLDRIDSRKRRDAVEQSGSWIEQILGKDGMLQNRVVPGQKFISGKNRILQSRTGRTAE